MAEYDYFTAAGRRDALKDYLNRKDLNDTQLDFMLGTGFRKTARRLRVRQNEVRLTFAGDETLTLPDDYIEARTLTCDNYPLLRVSDSGILTLTAEGHAGFPEQFGRVGNDLVTYPVSDSADYEIVLTYYADVSRQVGGDAVVADLCPEAWIYAGAMEAAPFLSQDPGRAQQMAAMFEGAIEVVNYVSDREQVSGSPVRVSVVAT